MVDFSISGKVVSEHLEELFRLYGPPKMIRRDNGPEFKSKHFKALIHRWNIEEEVIPPDSHLIMVIWKAFTSFCALNA